MCTNTFKLLEHTCLVSIMKRDIEGVHLEWWMVDMFVHSLHGTYQLGMHHLLVLPG